MQNAALNQALAQRQATNAAFIIKKVITQAAKRITCRGEREPKKDENKGLKII